MGERLVLRHNEAGLRLRMKNSKLRMNCYDKEREEYHMVKGYAKCVVFLRSAQKFPVASGNTKEMDQRGFVAILNGRNS